MQDLDVNLIYVKDGIDSSKEAGKLMISVLSAVAEIERENIRIQTMEGRMQKAREGKWNGGFAPYGYKLVDGLHEAIVSEDVWKVAQEKIERYADRGCMAIRVSSIEKMEQDIVISSIMVVNIVI